MGWMKGLLSLLIMSSAVVFYTNSDNTQAERDIQPIETILELVEYGDMALKEWQVLARDVQGTIDSEKMFQKHVHKLRDQLEGWDQTYYDTSATEWTAEFQLTSEGGVTESIRLMAYPENGTHTLASTYKLVGTRATDWHTYKLEEQLQDRLLLFSMDTASLFTQVQGTQDALTNKNDSLLDQAHVYMEKLDAKEVEALTEETFVSVSAYTTVWKDQLNTGDQTMNVQIALRSDKALGEGTTVTIGTPIITTEY